jgi:hypothetical protein
VEGSYENGNEPLGYIKFWEIVQRQADFQEGLSSMELVRYLVSYLVNEILQQLKELLL